MTGWTCRPGPTGARAVTAGIGARAARDAGIPVGAAAVDRRGRDAGRPRAAAGGAGSRVADTDTTLANLTGETCRPGPTGARAVTAGVGARPARDARAPVRTTARRRRGRAGEPCPAAARAAMGG